MYCKADVFFFVVVVAQGWNIDPFRIRKTSTRKTSIIRAFSQSEEKKKIKFTLTK